MHPRTSPPPKLDCPDLLLSMPTRCKLHNTHIKPTCNHTHPRVQLVQCHGKLFKQDDLLRAQLFFQELVLGDGLDDDPLTDGHGAAQQRVTLLLHVFGQHRPRLVHLSRLHPAWARHAHAPREGSFQTLVTTRRSITSRVIRADATPTHVVTLSTLLMDMADTAAIRVDKHASHEMQIDG